jgi:L-iditol 2-dehydrogenase
MKAALLHGPGDLRIEDVAESGGGVLVTVGAATACATDVKCLRHGHLILGPYPARFGHETVGAREDAGARVLVGDPRRARPAASASPAARSCARA